MRRIPAAVASIGLMTFASLQAATAPRPGTDWPQFRGISAQGIAEGFSVPATWNAATGENVLWKTRIPGLGLSSPIVWGDTVFISTAISGKADAGLRVGYYGDIQSVPDETEHEWRVYALDKKTGAIKWQHSPYKGVPKIKRHLKGSQANCTPVSCSDVSQRRRATSASLAAGSIGAGPGRPRVSPIACGP